MIGKTFDGDWIAISPTIPTRQTLCEQISYSDYKFPIYQPIGENVLNLESNVKQILRELTPLKLALCYAAGYSYDYIYQLCYTVSTKKESAITQSLIKSGLLKIKYFNGFLSNYINPFYEDVDRKRQQILVRFFKEKLLDMKIYHLALYDIDYTYILGETPDKDYLGNQNVRELRIKPLKNINQFIFKNLLIAKLLKNLLFQSIHF